MIPAPLGLSVQVDIINTCTLATGVPRSLAGRKSMSLCVIRPRRRLLILPFSVIGIPEKPSSRFTSFTSATVCVGDKTTGLVMNPCR